MEWRMMEVSCVSMFLIFSLAKAFQQGWNMFGSRSKREALIVRTYIGIQEDKRRGRFCVFMPMPAMPHQKNAVVITKPKV
jgi:hypothetical protein